MAPVVPLSTSLTHAVGLTRQLVHHQAATLRASTPLEILKTIVFYGVVIRVSVDAYGSVARHGPVGAINALIKYLTQKLISLARAAVPGADALVKKEVEKTVKGLQAKLTAPGSKERSYRALPAHGLTEVQIRAEHQIYLGIGKDGERDWKTGKVSGAVYHGGEALSKLITEACGLWAVSNPLHPEIFPAIRKMEAEVISMVLRMYNAPDGACGNMTSGGTESLLMAVKTYRDLARATRGVTEPEMVVPTTIHAAFDKAASYFSVKLIHVPVDPKTGQVVVSKVASAINRNTILIAGSAPNFPHGIIDDIPALAALAKKHNIGMHVDCCLGGFIVPFLEKAGFPLPYHVDFRVSGVTSISVDPHKYGFAPKGSSVILYRSNEIRNYQYFVTTEWPGGVYASPSLAGSRPGSLVAGTWTAMVHMGENGYVQSTREIVSAARKLVKAIESIGELTLVGSPLGSVVAFRSSGSLNIYGVGDILSAKHWHLNMLQNPAAIHIACTYLTVRSIDNLIADIKEAIEMIKKDPKAGDGEVAAIYGTMASVPDRSVIVDVSRGFLDALTMMA